MLLGASRGPGLKERVRKRKEEREEREREREQREEKEIERESVKDGLQPSVRHLQAKIIFLFANKLYFFHQESFWIVTSSAGL